MTDDLTIKPLPTELVHQFLPFAREHIEAALGDTDITFDQAKVYLAQGSWHMALVLDKQESIVGAYTYSVTNGPNDRTFMIVTAGGNGLASQGCFDQLCEIAKGLGATKIQALAGEAAARLYKRVGLEQKAALMEKKLWVA